MKLAHLFQEFAVRTPIPDGYEATEQGGIHPQVRDKATTFHLFMHQYTHECSSRRRTHINVKAVCCLVTLRSQHSVDNSSPCRHVLSFKRHALQMCDGFVQISVVAHPRQALCKHIRLQQRALRDLCSLRSARPGIRSSSWLLCVFGPGLACFGTRRQTFPSILGRMAPFESDSGTTGGGEGVRWSKWNS